MATGFGYNLEELNQFGHGNKLTAPGAQLGGIILTEIEREHGDG